MIRAQSSKQWRGKVAFRDVPMRPEVHAALVAYLSTRHLLPAADLFPFQAEEPCAPTAHIPIHQASIPPMV